VQVRGENAHLYLIQYEAHAHSLVDVFVLAYQFNFPLGTIKWLFGLGKIYPRCITVTK
jgi:hypothetical protein